MSSIFKRLELSGFKSFAKAARFDFESPIVAIVGPNGSGKSNVVEAIRWVLGEQSFKSLRGHRGEDLIFNGSTSSPRLGKASVSAIFDNTSKHFPVDFREVAIGRRVYRDGKGEYLVNDSEVRLKDVIELLAHVGLGISQHPIISQGEADRILYVSPKDRQSMIEESLGLKVYQYKREEAEKKLQQTEDNMRKAQALRAEVRPHLDHLKRLVEKYERATEIRAALASKASEYLSRWRTTLERDRAAADGGEKEAELKAINKKLEKFGTPSSAESDDTQALLALEAELKKLREKRVECERELGRAEGALESMASGGNRDDDAIPREEVEELLMRAEDDLSGALESDSIPEIHEIVQIVTDRLGAFLMQRTAEEKMRGDTKAYALRAVEWKRALADIAKKETALSDEWERRWSRAQEMEAERRNARQEIAALEARSRECEDAIRRAAFAEEVLKNREAEWERCRQDIVHWAGSEVALAASAAPFIDEEREAAQKAIDRLKFRLEEAGGVDTAVLREYDDAKTRDRFFEKELTDLVSSAKQLRGVSKELAEKIESDFSRGLGKITSEFDRFFQLMFGGGRAALTVLRERSPLASEDEDAPRPEGGVHIDVALPRKKIRGLEMLSGGERSLTAVALLFALSAVSPPPFLVLDETDAALDEANSVRYGDMLKELSRSTQIITITHNRQTMRRAGVLYGVTAGSDGISRLLSLKLAQAEEMAES
ncbi:MAG: AAA family ATPase [Candidatus Niyogibacteria bacterium]|nr:AAA family ATPase [Candidatus Niyogibacteria bacterium]